jgi:phosphohistidine phosphatase
VKLYILRHGDAAAHGDPRYKETERPLTPKGIRRTKLLAHALRQMEISFDAIFSSPLTRARQTADIVQRGLHLTAKKLSLTDHLAPSGSMENLVQDLNALGPASKNVLLVGHEPYLSGFISLLCVGGPDLLLELKKGALCRLETDVPSCSRCATLEWLLPPRLLGFNPPKRNASKR